MARRRNSKDEEPEDLSAALRRLGEGLSAQASRPNIHGYKPHEKQEIFHSAGDHGRLFIGGNRSGKTVGGVAEDIYWLRRDHPHRKLPISPGEPVRGRVVGVDFKEGVQQILLPEYKRWLPPSLLINGSWDDSYSKSLDLLTLANGSTVEFMSYEQDTAKFAGVSRHFVHFDEEPPKHIFDECMLRLLDTDGSWWITMTPLLGMTWLYDDIYLPGSTGEKDYKIIEVSSSENKYLNEGARQRILGMLSEEDRKAREHGTFIEVGGKIFKQFSRERHVIEKWSPMVEGAKNGPWRYYVSIDSGWNNPTAILWHAVNAAGRVVTFKEHYFKEMTVEQHAGAIKHIEQELGIADKIFIRTGDPAIKQTREGTGTSIQQEYAKHGIYISLEGVPTGPGSVAVGIERMQQYLGTAEQAPSWHITADCVNLVREIQRLHWAAPSSKKLQQTLNAKEAIHKKDDHACDSCRYFFTLMPYLAPDSQEMLTRKIEEGGRLNYDDYLRTLNQNAHKSSSDWTTDEGFDTM